MKSKKDRLASRLYSDAEGPRFRELLNKRVPYEQRGVVHATHNLKKYPIENHDVCFILNTENCRDSGSGASHLYNMGHLLPQTGSSSNQVVVLHHILAELRNLRDKLLECGSVMTLYRRQSELAEDSSYYESYLRGTDNVLVSLMQIDDVRLFNYCFSLQGCYNETDPLDELSSGRQPTDIVKSSRGAVLSPYKYKHVFGVEPFGVHGQEEVRFMYLVTYNVRLHVHRDEDGPGKNEPFSSVDVLVLPARSHGPHLLKKDLKDNIRRRVEKRDTATLIVEPDLTRPVVCHYMGVCSRLSNSEDMRWDINFMTRNNYTFSLVD